MQKTLPKGHTSCLSSQFKYTSATHTDLGKTFARIKQQLKGQSEGGPGEGVSATGEKRTLGSAASASPPAAVMSDIHQPGRNRPRPRARA